MNDITPVTDATDAQRAIALVKGLMAIVGTLRSDVFRRDVDYGVIPGTGDKPVLLLPGMEKLLRALRLRPEYHALSIVEDFEKPLFVYRYECRLYEIESGLCVSTAIGSANSYEKKWRYRSAERVCPSCGKPAIIKGKAEYGGGWLCYRAKGGCGAKFTDDDKAIIGQVVGQVENREVFDLVNTIDKIAQKRALASAIKGAANVSEFFTVDLEDFEPVPPMPQIVVARAAETVDVSTGEIALAPAPIGAADAAPTAELREKKSAGKAHPDFPPPAGYAQKQLRQR